MSAADVQKLTPRQKEILYLLLDGFDTKSAARELGISAHTVTEHLREARRHLGVSSSREAARILKQAETAPPDNMGPSNIRVAEPNAAHSFSRQPSPKSRLAHWGVSVMILLAAAVAIALSLSDSGAHLLRSDASPDSLESTAAEANPSPYPVRDIPVATFDELKVSGPFKVGVFISNEPNRVRLQGPAALIADTVVAVENGTLIIRFREGAKWSWNPGSGMNVVVSTPSLSAVKLDGAGNVEIFGLEGETFAATTGGSGSIRATGLDVGSLQLASEGAGGISVEGSAREATYIVEGAGSIDAMRLRVPKASIAVRGAGSSYANVSGDANISLSGSGRVEVVGGATCIKQPLVSDRIECH